MKKNLLTVILAAASISLFSQNTLLQSPITGQPYSSGRVDDIALVSNGTDVVLVAANNANAKLYAIDINDNNPADAPNNVITLVTTFKAKLQAALGTGVVTIKNFEVNPISKSVYVLAHAGSASYLAVVRNNGNTITAFPLTNVTYSEISFTSGKLIQDITSGNGELYFSIGSSSLAGEVCKTPTPFVHGSAAIKRSTTMYKSNWGGYFTNAPLEKMDFHNVAGTNRLSGVTVCAPGFSMKASDVVAGGLLTVTEDFDLWNGPTRKVVAIKTGTTSYLIDLHDENFNGNYAAYRIGHKFLDGSQVPLNKFNNQSTKLRSAGNPFPGLTVDEIKKYSGYYSMIAFYSDCDLLALDNLDNLKLISTESCAPTQIAENEIKYQMNIYPNPASTYFSIHCQQNLGVNNLVNVYSVDGKLVLQQNIKSNDEKINIENLTQGTYFVSVLSEGKQIYSDKLIK